MNKRIAVPIIIVAMALCILCPIFAADTQPPAAEDTYTVMPVYQEAVAEPQEINTRPFTAEEEIMLAKLVWGEARGGHRRKMGRVRESATGCRDLVCAEPGGRMGRDHLGGGHGTESICLRPGGTGGNGTAEPGL